MIQEAASTAARLGVLVWVYRCVRLCLSGSRQTQLRRTVSSKRACVRASPGFSPPATELDLNSGAVRGDREGYQKRREVTKDTRTAEDKPAATCSDKEKKGRRFGCPPGAMCGE